MKKIVLAIITIALLGVTVAFGGDTLVGGPVSGKWLAGMNYRVSGDAYVPANSELSAEPGVLIEFLAATPFMVYGTIDFKGSAEFPIFLSPPPKWEGIVFIPENPVFVTQQLSHVMISAWAPLPRKVISGNNADLIISYCNFRAEVSCLDMRGGKVRASFDTMMTTGLYSKVITLRRMDNDGLLACDSLRGNYIKNCFMRVDVPLAADTLPWTDDFTTGLQIERTNNICLSDSNVFIVSAPSSAIGMCISGLDAIGSGRITLGRSIVAVRSLNGASVGIMNLYDGFLHVLHCKIDVTKLDPESRQSSIGVVASRLASVELNSTSLSLDAGDIFLQSNEHGSLTADYSCIFSPDHVAEKLHDANSGTIDDLDIETVGGGTHNIYVDPQWRKDGVWGDWDSFDDVYSYYSLLPTSPCIDAGDTTWGRDPDNSLPDIGCYYYQTSSVDNIHESGLPNSVSLSCAYPNPFNPETVIPFSLVSTGQVDIIAYDVLGRKVMNLVSGTMAAGSHRIVFSGSELSSGIYFVTVQFNGRQVGTQKLVLMK